jgi:hypothetical protein
MKESPLPAWARLGKQAFMHESLLAFLHARQLDISGATSAPISPEQLIPRQQARFPATRHSGFPACFPDSLLAGMTAFMHERA